MTVCEIRHSPLRDMEPKQAERTFSQPDAAEPFHPEKRSSIMWTVSLIGASRHRRVAPPLVNATGNEMLRVHGIYARHDLPVGALTWVAASAQSRIRRRTYPLPTDWIIRRYVHRNPYLRLCSFFIWLMPVACHYFFMTTPKSYQHIRT